MQILYCDSCGFRIPEKDLTDGRAIRTPEGKVHCEKCLPGKTAGRSSSHKMVPAHRASEKTSSIQIQTASGKSAAPAGARPAPAARPGAKSNATAIGIAVGVAIAVLLIALMSGSSRKPVEEARPAQPAPVPPPAVPPARVNAVRPAPEPAPRFVPQPDPVPAEAAPDEKAFVLLTRFEGREAGDAAGRVARIEAYLETYKDSILAARARALLAEWKAKAGTAEKTDPEAKTGAAEGGDPKPQEPPPGGKARAALAGTDETTRGHWKGVHGQDGYYLPGFLDKRQAPKGAIAKDRATDLLKLPSYVGSFTTDNDEIRGLMSDTPGDHWLDAPDGASRRLCYDVVPTNGAMTYKLAFTDDKPHRVALFFATGGLDRDLTVEVRDAGSQEVLHSRQIKGGFIGKGGYLIYEIAGNVHFVFRSNTSRARGLCSAVFFDATGEAAPAAPATGQAEGKETPAANDPDAAARVAELFAAELVAELRREAQPFLKAGRFAEAKKALEDKARLERYAPVAEAAALEADDLKALVEAKQAALEALKAQAGKSVTLTLSGRSIAGTLKTDAKRGDMSLRMSGGAEIAFSGDQLEPGDLVALLPRAAGDGRREDLRRRGLLYLCIGDAAMAKSCFAGAKDAGLERAERYLKQVETLELGEQEAGARALWDKGEACVKAAAWPDAQRAFQDLQQRFGSTRWVETHAAELKARLEQVELGLHPLLPGVEAAYYKGNTFEAADLCMTRVESNIDHDFDRGSPGPAVPVDNFSGRYTGLIKVAAAGRYTFATFSDDGSRLTVAGKSVFDRWVHHPPERTAGEIELAEGYHPFVLDYFEATSGAEIRFLWALKDGFAEQTVPGSVLFHRGPALPPPAGARAYLSDLAETAKVGFGKFRKGSAEVADISVGGVKPAHWLYAHADSSIVYTLGKQYRRLDLGAAINDTGRAFKGRMKFVVALDGKEAWFSNEAKPGAAPVPCVLDVTDVEKLELRASATEQGYAHPLWIEPFLTK
ncbi:MAG: NPCBM/NEW2 domain-containing protein [Planctomycetota bacterium]|nr:NPCBM/NEW2 domain-containing protein [Planctomycetota bacterium]